MPAATKHGIVVANAPQSNVVTAAEHTMALLLALARNVPQAHASLVAGRWDRSKYSASRSWTRRSACSASAASASSSPSARWASGCASSPSTRSSSAERYRELGVEKAESTDALYARADFLTLHLPKTPETEGFLDAEALAKCKDGVRVLNVARGPLIVDEDLQAALDSGKVAGAALDVFRSEPVTDHPLFGYPNVIVTPHLGASTAEATDRAGYQAAEQVVAALTGGAVSTAVNVPAVAPEDLEVLGPFLPLCRRLGRLAMGLAEGSSVERVEVEFLGRIAERDTRPLGLAALVGVLTGHVEEEVNEVSAPAIAEERGIDARRDQAHAGARLHRPRARDRRRAATQRARVAGTTLGRQHRPHLVEAWGQRFNVQMEDDYIVLFRYRDKPGMMGRAGMCFGANGVNINSAAVGHVPAEAGGNGGLAVMVLTTDAPVPQSVLDEILSGDGFFEGRFIALR